MNEHPLPYQNSNLPIETRLADLLSRMTLEEKVAQIQRMISEKHGFSNPPVFLDDDGNLVFDDPDAQLDPGVFALGRTSLRHSPRRSAEVVNHIQKQLLENTRLGIPALCTGESLHGLMATGATSFPQAIALASTWDPELVERIFTAAAREARSRGENYMFTPVLDLARDPRWGRTEETYGEDPYLAAEMGSAAVRGLQGSGPQIDRQHVLATAKHFAVHGQPEGGTNAAPGNISERIIREQFLFPFQRAIVEAGAASVMASYNEIDGIPSHINPWLLGKILREEWGFRGFVISDGRGIHDLVSVHHAAADEAEAARLSLEAGIDAELGDCFVTLVDQVRSGRIAEAELDRAVANVLRAKFQLGLFEDPYADPDEAERINNCAEHRQLALQAAQESIILLKNEGNLLPLDASQLRKLAVIGPNATGLHLGGYSYHPGQGLSILDGLRDYAAGRFEVLYAEGSRISQPPNDWQAWWVDTVLPPDPDEEAARLEQAVKVAQQADLVLLVLGENEATCREGWSKEHLGDRDSLDLPGGQNELASRILETGKPVVVLLINGRPLSINLLAEHAPVILEGWYLGQEGARAVAQTLFGEVNPSGKLPITFPRGVGQIPAYYNHKPSARRGFVFSDIRPLFPFGHGLSYTSFAYDNLRIEPERILPGGSAQVSVELTNTGKRSGAEVVQFYLRDRVSSVTRPVLELKGFRRVQLDPGQTQTVTFQLTPAELSFLDRNMQSVVEPGIFEVYVGGSSAELQTVLLEVTWD